MPAAPRIAPATLFTPQEWRPFQSRSAWVGPLLVLHCWAVIALAVTAGSETRSSMAWVIIGGLLTSTVFTLLVLPMIFLFFEEHPMVQWIRKKVGV